jgi:hypothetical protein
MTFEEICYGDTNTNPETGVHYGVISEHSIGEGLLDDIYMNGTRDAEDAAYEELVSEGKTEDEIRDALECADFSDSVITYEDDEYRIQLFPWYGVYVMKSPIIVKCQRCSPCSPNAGNLDYPEEDGIPTYGLKPEDMRKEDE